MDSLILSRLKSRFLLLLESSYVRVAVALLLALTAYILLLTYFVNSYTNQQYEFRKQELKRLVDVGLNTIQPIRQQQSGGELAPEEARASAVNLVRRMTYTYVNDRNYLFMSSYDGKMLVQPFEPEKEGTDQWNLKDVNGKYIIRELIAMARSPAGAGYVDYWYPPPGSDQPQIKVSYVVGIPEWDCYIGTGMYLGDINAENAGYIRNSLFLTGGLALLILGVIFLALRPLMSSHRKLLNLFDEISQDPNTLPEVTPGRLRPGSEGWRLLNGFQEMLGRVQTSRHELESAYQTLERRVQERTHELATLNAIAEVVSRSLNLSEIMSQALERTMHVIGVEKGAAFCLEDADRTLVLMAHRGLSEEFARFASRLPLDVALSGKTLDGERPMVWNALTDFPEGELKAHILSGGLASLVGVPLLAKGKLVGGLVIGTENQRILTEEESSLVSSIGRQVGLAVENARLFRSEQDRHAEAERRRRVAECLRDILAVLNSKQSLADTLSLIVTQACRVLDSDAATIIRPQAKEGPFRVEYAYGLNPEIAAQIEFPLWVGASGLCLARRQPVAIPDTMAAIAEPGDLLDDLPISQRPFLQGMVERYHASLVVPIIVRDDAYGVIALYYHDTHPFSQDEIELAMSVANQTALAIETARLREQAEQTAATAERSRLARELHDSVTQLLYSVTLYAEAVARLLGAGQQARAVEHLAELRSSAQQALREMRLLIFELRPPTLEKSGLAAALQARLDAVETRGGMQAKLQIEGEERLPNAVQKELYYIALEALNNALKHSRAQSVQVDLRFGSASTSVEVRDDGIGFEPAIAHLGEGFGISGMNERVQRIGGHLEITSSPGRGTQVRVHVPTGHLS